MPYQFDPTIISRLLSGLGAAASSYGSGSPQWGYAGAQAMDQQAQEQQQRAQQDLQTKLTQLQIQRETDAESADKTKQAAAKSWLLGQNAPTSGLYDGQGRPGPSSVTPGALDGLPEAHRSLYQSYASIDPVAAAQMAGQEMLKDPAKPDAPIIQDFDEGGNVVKKQWDSKTNTWTSLSTAPRWQPVQPPQLPGDYLVYQQEKKADPTIKSYASWKQMQVTPKTPGITTLYDGKGGQKSVQDNDPSIPGLLSGGWTNVAPAKATVTYQTVTGEAVKALNANLDPTKTWKVGSDGTAEVVDKPDKAGTTYKTVTGPDAASLNLDPAKTWSIGSDGSSKVIDKPEAAAGAIITGDDAKSHNLDPTGTYQARPDGTYAVLVKPRTEGVYGGQGVDQQDSNIILKGQSDDAYRATPEYAMAWTRQYQTPHYQSVQDQNDPAKTTLVAIPPTVPQGMKPPASPTAAAAAVAPTGATPAQAPAPAAAQQPSTPAAIPVPGTQSQKQLNAEQSLSKGFAERMQSSDAIISKFAKAGTSVVKSLEAGVPIVGNLIKGSDRQQFDQAAQNFINAQLRRESGAAISQSELDAARKQYIPQPFDGTDLIAQKAANRAEVIRGMQQNASPYPLPNAPSKDDLKKKYGLQ